MRLRTSATAAVMLAASLAMPGLARAASAPCHSYGVPSWDHVVVIVMENHGYSQVVGHSPYVDTLIAQCASATNYHGVAYPSLPNYLAMTGGSTFGVHDDGPPSAHPIDAPSIFGQVDSRSLEENMVGNCSVTKRSLYAVKHNPHAYYVPVRAQCQSRDVPLTYPLDLSATFTFITPNMCHDTHNSGCTVAQGDTFLSGLIDKVIASPEYSAGRTAVFLTWDTDNRKEGNHIPLVVVAPSAVPGSTDTVSANHYDLIATIEDMLGVSKLGSGTSMRAGLHL